MGPTAKLYVALQYAQNQIVQFDTATGASKVIAGVVQTDNSGGYTDGDDGPATSAHIANAGPVAVGPDGSVFFAQITGYVSGDGYCVRKIDPSGTMLAVAGICGSEGSTADGSPAAGALLGHITGLAVGTDDTVYFSDYTHGVVRKVGADGVLHTIATLPTAPGPLAVARNGTVYVAADFGVFRISPNGDLLALTSVTNDNDCGIPYQDGQLASTVHLCYEDSLALDQDERNLYINDGTPVRLEVQPMGFAGVPLQVPAQDGSEAYLFDANGVHTDTKLLPSGATRFHFEYTADGLLATVTDGYGNVTQIQRTGDTPTAIVSPYGVTTQMGIGSDGYLASAVGPTGANYTMAYESGGLLDTIQFPTGSSTVYSSKDVLTPMVLAGSCRARRRAAGR